MSKPLSLPHLVWLPISNIYEERALGRGETGRSERGAGARKGYSVMPALKNGQTRGVAGPAVYMSNLHFQYFLLGRKHQLSSLPASQPLSMLGVEWHCQASRPRTKVAPALYNSQSSLGEPPLLFLETWQVLPSLSSFAMHNRPRPCWIYFRKSFLPCEREPPPPPPPPLPPGHSTLENEEQLENAGKERER